MPWLGQGGEIVEKRRLDVQLVLLRGTGGLRRLAPRRQRLCCAVVLPTLMLADLPRTSGRRRSHGLRRRWRELIVKPEIKQLKTFTASTLPTPGFGLIDNFLRTLSCADTVSIRSAEVTWLAIGTRNVQAFILCGRCHRGVLHGAGRRKGFGIARRAQKMIYPSMSIVTQRRSIVGIDA